VLAAVDAFSTVPVIGSDLNLAALPTATEQAQQNSCGRESQTVPAGGTATSVFKLIEGLASKYQYKY